MRKRGTEGATRLVVLILLFLPLSVPSCCGYRPAGKAPGAAKTGVRHRLRLATTTSAVNSGILDHLLPAFEKRLNVKVDVLPVGSGKAFRLAEQGDVDLVLVHAPAAEDEFLAGGFGVNRRVVMYNDFVIAGPGSDPAGVRSAGSAADAMSGIAAAGAAFVSRGDDSGTHRKEKELWESAGVNPEGGWYIDAGRGMGAVLMMASEKEAYTLTDRGTFLSMKGKLELDVLFEGDPALDNPYSVIAVNPARCPDCNYMGAMTLIAWLTSPEAQKMIADFNVAGARLFHPVSTPETPPGR
ncbi:MAG: substrate-binding domain-containing protein [bacterium]